VFNTASRPVLGPTQAAIQLVAADKVAGECSWLFTSI